MHVSPVELLEAHALVGTARGVVLVEGRSDQTAVHTLAALLGRDLAAERLAVLPMGGATNIGHFLAAYGPRGADLQLAGLCDAGEQREFCRALDRVGFGAPADAADLARLGFFVCRSDLEDELIRALGVDAVEYVIEAAGELASLRRLQQQPAQRNRTPAQQVRRFIGSRSGRKQRYARLLVEALGVERAPQPLAQLLAML